MNHAYLQQARDTLANVTYHRQRQLTYMVEPANWSCTNDGHYITSQLNSQGIMTARVATTARGLRHTIIHYGALPTFLTATGWRQVHPTNRVIITAFHLTDNTPARLLNMTSCPFTYLLTTNSIARRQLELSGIAPAQIKQIPLGVDTKLFQPYTNDTRNIMRKKLNLPKDKFIIGSFQKDGVGWGAGSEPKLIKGPDILAKVIAQVAKKYPIHVLLAGPARGYIQKELAKNNISFTSLGLHDNFSDIAPLYHALDCYLITSRVEGGPKQILEAWASGIPVVSTSVGMIPDIAINNQTAKLCPVGDTSCLVANVNQLITNPSFHQHLATQAIPAVKPFSWANIAKRYYQELYSQL